jgi:hypothetical protein
MGDLKRNKTYAVRAVQDSVSRGEAPFATHLYGPQFTADDADPALRRIWLDITHAWRIQASLVAFYVDLGMSDGMVEAQQLANKYKIGCDYRRIGL